MKANSTVYKSFKEMKESHNDRPFDPIKYENYIRGLKEFYEKYGKKDVINKRQTKSK